AIAIAALSATAFLLVLLRLAGVVRTNRQATERERGLREAGAVLVSATDTDTVRASVRTAVTRLLPSGRRHAVSLTLSTGVSHSGLSTSDDGQRFVRVSELPSADAAQLTGFEFALVNPLMTAERVAGYPQVGTLMVAADDADLTALQGSLA